MKILIAYASKNGTAERCVSRLCEKLGQKDITCVNLEHGTATVAEYDIVVFGSSVYFGKLRPCARLFLKQNQESLLKKRVALFLCCALDGEYEHYRKKLFPSQLLESAFETAFFGGSLRTDGLPFWDKMIIKSMRSSLFEAEMDNGEYFPNLPGTLPENIDKMASEIKKQIGILAKQA